MDYVTRMMDVTAIGTWIRNARRLFLSTVVANWDPSAKRDIFVTLTGRFFAAIFTKYLKFSNNFMKFVYFVVIARLTSIRGKVIAEQACILILTNYDTVARHFCRYRPQWDDGVLLLVVIWVSHSTVSHQFGHLTDNFLGGSIICVETYRCMSHCICKLLNTWIHVSYFYRLLSSLCVPRNLIKIPMKYLT